jgi:hypothetical protein
LTVVWPLVVVLALGGWGWAGGWALERLAGVESHPLQDALPVGVALVLAIAGTAVALDAFSGAVVAVLVAAGAALTLLGLGRWALTSRGRGREVAPVLGSLAVMIGAVFLQVRWETARFMWNACDDDVGYLYLARRLVLRGDLLDPLNNRRLTSLGGMSALQALFLARLPDSFLPMPDLLVGSLLVLAGLWRTRSGTWSGWGIAAALAVVFLHPSLGASNTSPVLLPIGMTIAAFLWAIRLRTEAATPRAEVASAGVLGLLVGAVATLRPQYDLPLGVLLLVAVSPPPLGAGAGRRLAGSALGLGAATAGWLVASWRAAGTPMFPLFAGNLDPTWPANGPAVPVPSLPAYLGATIATPGGVRWSVALAGSLCLAAYLLIRSGGGSAHTRWGVRLLVATAAAGVAWAAWLADTWWGLGPFDRYPRFWAPVLLACVLLPVTLIGGARLRPAWLTNACGLAALVLVFLAAGVGPRLVANSVRSVAVDTVSGGVNATLVADRYESRRDQYASAAASIRPGSRVLAAVDVPSLLLANGADIDTIDLVGSTSPPPRLPYRQGTEAKLAWLRAHGYRYLVAVDPDASVCLYSRSRQEEDLVGRQGQPYEAWAPYYLDWFRFLDDVSSGPGSQRFGSLIVVRI